MLAGRAFYYAFIVDRIYLNTLYPAKGGNDLRNLLLQHQCALNSLTHYFARSYLGLSSSIARVYVLNSQLFKTHEKTAFCLSL
jgi:hypothetical protein